MSSLRALISLNPRLRVRDLIEVKAHRRDFVHRLQVGGVDTRTVRVVLDKSVPTDWQYRP
jgi:hypothetical protein